jgi:hypothetical protein
MIQTARAENSPEIAAGMLAVRSAKSRERERERERERGAFTLSRIKRDTRNSGLPASNNVCHVNPA